MILSGVNAEEIPYRQLLQLNAKGLSKIEIGMTIDKVKSIMKGYTSSVPDGALSNPWKIEKNNDTEIFHYLTKRYPPFTSIRESQAVPIIFVDGSVSAIGRNFLESARASSESTDEAEKIEETIEARLIKLKNLYDKELIDKQTYNEQRTRILNSI